MNRAAAAIAWGIVVACGCFVFFYALDVVPIRLWDESRVAVNALGIFFDDHWLVLHYEGAPDHWNTKPPLMVWAIAASMKIWGPAEFAVRFPAALSAFATTLLLLGFCIRFLDDLKAGVIAAFVLMSSVGFIGDHVASSGDYDAMLVLWTTVGVLSFFVAMEDPARQGRFMMIAGVAFALAVLTKGIAGLLGLPGLLVYALWQRKGDVLFKSWSTYAAVGVALVLVLGYYGSREMLDPGYIAAVYQNELGGRFAGVQENNSGVPLYYVYGFLAARLLPWIYLVPVAGVVMLLRRGSRRARAGSLVAWFTGGFLVVISMAQTKVPWYDAPIYPLAALLLGVTLSMALDYVFQGSKPRWMRVLIVWLVVGALLAPTFVQVVYRRVYLDHGTLFMENAPNHPRIAIGAFVQTLAQDHHKEDRIVAVDTTYNAALRFYVRTLNEAGHNVIVAASPDAIRPADLVVTCMPELKERLARRYERVELVRDEKPCLAFRAKAPAQHPSVVSDR